MNLLLSVCLFFISAGAFSFGGGYAVLIMLQQEVVAAQGWLSPQEFVNIIAIAEMTPGPIAVNTSTFVGYQLFGLFGGILCTLCIIAVPFSLSLTASIFFQKFRENRYLKSALKGIRPAVVGLIAAVSIAMARASFTDTASILIFAASLGLLWKFKFNPILVLLASGCCGIAVYGAIL
jgi:chromate transporter